MHWPTKSDFNWSDSAACIGRTSPPATAIIMNKEMNFIFAPFRSFPGTLTVLSFPFAQALEFVPRAPGLAIVALDCFLHRFGASIVQEFLAEAKTHQHFRAKIRRLGLPQTDVGKLGSHRVHQQVRIER